MPFGKKALSLFILISLFLILFQSLSLADFDSGKSQYQVLMISSYNSRFPTFFKQIDGIKSVLDAENYAIDLEFMDLKRFNSEEQTALFYQALKYKLSHASAYDFIIVCDDNAYNFALEHQTELFQDIPIVFLGINNIDNALMANQMPLVSGVIENISMEETLESAKALLPQATTVYAIVDNTLAGKGDLEKYQLMHTAFPDLTFEVLSLEDMSFDELGEKLSKMGSHEIVLLLAAYSDITGRTLPFEQSLKLIVDSSAVPIFHLYEHGIGDGLLGGCVISHYQQGIEAAKIVKSVLEGGRSYADLAVIITSPNKYLFDYACLQKYDLRPSALPDDTLYLNRTPSFWEQYFDYIILGTIILIFILFFLIYLIYYIMKCKSIERSLIEKNEDIQNLYEELLASEEELKTQNEALVFSQNTLLDKNEELIRKQKIIEDYAFYDYLTHLPNRHTLKLDIQKILVRPVQNIIKGALFFIDFDNFKNINDHYGHTFGDEVLITISERLLKTLGDNGKVYRFGGDEFIALIDTASDQNTLDYIADRIFDGFTQPLSLRGTEITMTFSMGIAIIPLHGNSYDDLIGSADMAMYTAKNSGKNKYFYFDENSKKQSEYIALLKQELKQAITSDQLFLNYQPIYNKKNNRIQFIEAVLRWQSPFGYIAPKTFIPFATEMELMLKLQQYVFSEVCELSNIVNTSENSTFITFNLSSKELLDALIIRELEQVLMEKKADASTICLEISETIIENEFDHLLSQITALRKLGFKIIIDDFGTEYLSLNYLKKLPVDLLKIDISFFYEHGDNHSMLKALIDIIRELDIEVIIKGIESDTHLEYLKNFDYTFVQGFYYGYPVTRERIMNIILDEDIKIYHPQNNHALKR